jgi:hypothetical protein
MAAQTLIKVFAAPPTGRETGGWMLSQDGVRRSGLVLGYSPVFPPGSSHVSNPETWGTHGGAD